jgi:copper homeostasis protein
MITLEVCANSITSALAAQNGGAARVELCDNLSAGGITTSIGQFIQTKKLLQIPVHTLIRPRPGDFLYSDLEFEIMKTDISNFISAGCDGIVIGILNPDGTIDKDRNAELAGIVKSAGVSVTFHRAFDMCNDLFKALEDIIAIGCDRILTSGGKSTAMEGISTIAHLIKAAAGRISIMPGSGINEHNIAHLVHFSGATEFHTSARTRIDSEMQYHNDHILLSDTGEEFTLEVTDAEKVRNLIKLANG